MSFCLGFGLWFFFFGSAFNSSSLTEEKEEEKRAGKPVILSVFPFVLDVVCSETNGDTGIKKRL